MTNNLYLALTFVHKRAHYNKGEVPYLLHAAISVSVQYANTISVRCLVEHKRRPREHGMRGLYLFPPNRQCRSESRINCTLLVQYNIARLIMIHENARTTIQEHSYIQHAHEYFKDSSLFCKQKFWVSRYSYLLTNPVHCPAKGGKYGSNFRHQKRKTSKFSNPKSQLGTLLFKNIVYNQGIFLVTFKNRQHPLLNQQ